jgi:NUMOD3 motif
MNHQKIYESIIKNALLKNRIKQEGIYYENHHILPKCLNGSNKKENKVLLTAKEHFICHKLLTYIYPNNKSIHNAFYLMSSAGKHKYNVTAKDYEYAKKLFVSIPVSIDTKTKMSKSLKGKNKGKIPINKGTVGLYKHSEESKEKISINNAKNKPWLNKTLSKEHKDNISKSNKGKNKGRIPWNKGKPAWNKDKNLSDKTKEKMKISAKNRKTNIGKW